MGKHMRRPDFFIVGAPKCGTTAMNYYLKQHPDIFIAKSKEMHFFGSDLDFSNRIRIRYSEEEYLSYFSGAKNQKRAGESSVFYLYSERAAAEIKEFCPSANIIIMLRNPVDMLYSWHSQSLYNGDENIDDFESALDAEDHRKRGLCIPQRGIFPVKCLFYREVAKYTQQVQRYLDTFGNEKVHIIIFDDLRSDTAKVYQETLCFLGVNPGFQPKFRVVNPNKSVRSKAVRNFSLWLRGTCIPIPLRRRLLQGIRFLNTRYEPRSPMDPKLRRRLQAEFISEVEGLSQLLGRDLMYWID